MIERAFYRLTWRTYFVVFGLVAAALGLDPGIAGWVLFGWFACHEWRIISE